MLKILIWIEGKGTIFSNFALISHFSIKRLGIPIFFNILQHLEMNFQNLC